MAFEKFLKYKEAIEKDLKIDQFNIHNKVNDIPSLKHFWVSKLIESNTDVSEALFEINSIDKKINQILSKSQKSMKKINTMLKKLPNPALENNILNISIKP